MEIIRRECESCDCIQAFQLSHSIGGGTGSGFGSLLLCRLYDEFPDILLMNASVFPSTQVSDVVVEPYNTILSMAYLVDYSNGVFCIDNEALYKICMNKLKVDRINYNTINQLIASTLGGVTTSLRFPGQVSIIYIASVFLTFLTHHPRMNHSFYHCIMKTYLKKFFERRRITNNEFGTLLSDRMHQVLL